MTRTRLLATCLAVCMPALLFAGQASAQEHANWDEVARKVIPEIESKMIEFTDFLRVYRKGDCKIDLTVRVSNVSLPITAQIKFGFHDADDDGELTHSELTWKKLYVSSTAMAIFLKDVKRSLFAKMVISGRSTLRSGKVTGEELPTGYLLRLGQVGGDDAASMALHVSRHHIVEKAVLESEGGSVVTTFTYENRGNRLLCVRTKELAAGNDGGRKTTTSQFAFSSQDGCELPTSVTSNTTVNIRLSHTSIHVTTKFRDWKLVKRPRVFPRAGEVPVTEPTPEGETDPGTTPGETQVPAGGATAAREYFAGLSAKYLFLGCAGPRTVLMSGTVSGQPAEVDPNLEVTWTAPGEIGSPTLTDPRNAGTDMASLLPALERNPLFIQFSLVRLPDGATHACAPDGTVTITDPARGITWNFGPDGRLASITTEGERGKLVRHFEWIKAGGGFLLKRSSVDLGGGAALYQSYSYRVFGSLLLPSRVAVGARTTALPGHLSRDKEVISWTVTGTRNENGDFFEPGREDVSDGAPLTGIRLLPGAGVAAPAERDPVALARNLDAGLQKVPTHVADLACDIVVKSPTTEVPLGKYYWLAPGRHEVVYAAEVRGGLSMRSMVDEAMDLNPLFLSYGRRFAGATASARDGGGSEVVTRKADGQRVYMLDAARALTSVVRKGPLGVYFTTTLSMANAGEGHGRLLETVVFAGDMANGRTSVGVQYTRSPGFIVLRRLNFTRQGTPETKVEFTGWKVNEGLAKRHFGGGTGGGLFDD